MVGTNCGHGHVWKRPDGITARCGGPVCCGQCGADWLIAHGEQFDPGRDVVFKPLPALYVQPPELL